MLQILRQEYLVVHLEGNGEGEEKCINHKRAGGQPWATRSPLALLPADPVGWTTDLDKAPLGHIGWCLDQCGPVLSIDSHSEITRPGPNPFPSAGPANPQRELPQEKPPELRGM